MTKSVGNRDEAPELMGKFVVHDVEQIVLSDENGMAVGNQDVEPGGQATRRAYEGAL